MRRSDFNFDLPPELIAQRPADTRSESRLLALDGTSGSLRDLRFRNFPSLLSPPDLLVFNDTRVIPARIRGTKESGGRVEILLERAVDAHTALVHLRASKGLRPGATVALPGGQSARMLERSGDLYWLRFSTEVVLYFEAFGTMPLPPYIDRAPDEDDRARYQTVFARIPGAVAKRPRGCTSTPRSSRARGAACATLVTLHVGAGTFQPVREDNIENHEMHEEILEVPAATCAEINAARAAGGRVIAVGTTVVRSLETAAAQDAPAAQHPAPFETLRPYRGATRIFIKPGHQFRAVDAMVTNFHLPESTLLMLCSAFVGRRRRC